jgi:hypothetical protein
MGNYRAFPFLSVFLVLPQAERQRPKDCRDGTFVPAAWARVDEGRLRPLSEPRDCHIAYLAVAPGVIMGYELGRGRGGPRCMTGPIERDPA